MPTPGSPLTQTKTNRPTGRSAIASIPASLAPERPCARLAAIGEPGRRRHPRRTNPRADATARRQRVLAGECVRALLSRGVYQPALTGPGPALSPRPRQSMCALRMTQAGVVEGPGPQEIPAKRDGHGWARTCDLLRLDQRRESVRGGEMAGNLAVSSPRRLRALSSDYRPLPAIRVAGARCCPFVPDRPSRRSAPIERGQVDRTARGTAPSAATGCATAAATFRRELAVSSALSAPFMR